MSSKAGLFILILAALILISSSSPIKISCREKKFKGENACHIKKLKITSKDEIVKVDSKNKIKALHIENEIVHYMPESLLKAFSNCIILHIVNSHLKSVKNSKLNSLKHLVEINLERNEITDLNADTFDGLTSLKIINLAHNKIAAVHFKTFTGNQALERLSLGFNEIERIHQNTFINLTSLEYLDLSNNKILELREGIFDHSPALNTVDLSSNKLKYIGENIFAEIATNLKTLRLNNNECIKTDESFVDSKTKALDFGKIKDALIENCLPVEVQECRNEIKTQREEKEKCQKDRKEEKLQLEEISKANEDAFNAEKLRLESECKENEAKALKSFKDKIASLEIELKEMKEKLMNERSNVEHHKVRLETLQNSMFDCDLERENVTRLYHLSIDETIKCAKDLRSKKFENCKSTESADLTTTEVTRDNDQCSNFDIICESPFHTTCKSQGVVALFANVKLTNKNAVASNDMLRLIVSDSFIKFLPADIFDTFRELKDVEITNSNVRHLAEGTFNGAKNLENLTITGNKISHIADNNFKGAVKLQFLELESNGIQTLSSKSFNGLDELDVLNLRQNEISEIPEKIFDGLIKLRILQLANNQIEHLNGKILTKNVNLEAIYVNRNPLITIGTQLLDNLANFKEIYFGKTACIKESGKAIKKEEFVNAVSVKCSV